MAALLAASAQARVPDEGETLASYARARAAAGLGTVDEASRGYAAALALSPDDDALAARALTQALRAGNRPLALAAARVLERKGSLAPDGRFLLFAEALLAKDWRTAEAQIDKIREDDTFAFMEPFLRAWTALGARRGDPVALLDAAAANPLGVSYAAEQRPLLLLALGREKEGLEAVAKLGAPSGGHGERIRIAFAAALARDGERAEALALLEGDSPAIAAARSAIERRRSPAVEIVTAAQGAGEHLLRVAVDLSRQNVDPLALSFARLATFLAPANGEAWLLTGQLLARLDQDQAALAALAKVRSDDPFFGVAQDSRVELLSDAGNQKAALGEAEGAANKAGALPADWARLGDLYGRLERHEDAAEAYRRALDLKLSSGAPGPDWPFWLLQGGAWSEAGKWPQAKAALEEAHRLAPNEAIVLNYLGYAQLERRENLEEAQRLIAEAARLEPDSPEITDSLGWSHYIRGNIPQAIEILERAARGAAADVEINEHLGDAYYSAGRRYEARYAWEAALVYAEEPEAKRLRAKIAAGLTPELASP